MRGARGDLMAKCSPQQAGHVIPAAVSPPHDQRAHGLPQDLHRSEEESVLTRRPLPEPSLPNRLSQKPLEADVHYEA